MGKGTDEIFDRLAEEYDAWFDGEGKLPFQIELEAFRAVIAALPQKRAILSLRPWLEVGVGSGRFAQSLGIDVGLDPSKKLLAIARRRGVNVILGRGEALPFPDGSFGTIFLIVTICFVPDPRPVLSECRRVLREDGRLVIGFIPRDSPWGRLYVEEGKQGHPFYSRARFYSIRELKDLLLEKGFEPERLVSTLFQSPGEVREPEAPQEGFDQRAGFVVMVARRMS